MDPTLREEEVLELLRNDGAGEDCEVVEYRMERAGGSPMGFLGEHGRLTVKWRTHGRAVHEKLYFVKTVPSGVEAGMREYLQELGCFRKEIALYRTIFGKLREAAPDMPKWHPECYYARGEELLVLEDLTQDGYYVYPERRLLDEEHLLSSLSALARMHAASIVFEDKLRSEAGGNALAPTTIAEVFAAEFSPTPSGRRADEVREAAISAQLKIVDLLPGYSAEQKEVVKRELPFRMRRILHLSKPSQKFRNVIVHGDLWANNLLFARGKGGRVDSARIVDFQLARYAPPAQDIVAFLHLVQSRRFREENHLRLLRHYYDALTAALARSGLKAEDFITWYELLGTCDYYEELGLITAIFFFQLILTPPGMCHRFFASPELFLTDRSEIVTECFSKDFVYRERVKESMGEFIKEYIL